MLYGMHIPLLFPIVGVALANQRFVERCLLAWYARVPPAMDDSLSNSIFQIIKYAPVFLVFNTYWLVDNHMFFDNHWTYSMRTRDAMRSEHLVGIHVNQAVPLLYCGMIAVMIFFCQLFFPYDIL